MTGETNQARLQARTLGRLTERYSATGAAEYECQPTSRAPVIFDDYTVGDVVTLHFNKGIEFIVQQRVVSAEISVSQQGIEQGVTLRFRGVS